MEFSIVLAVFLDIYLTKRIIAYFKLFIAQLIIVELANNALQVIYYEQEFVFKK